ncbi:MAG: thiamine ABC transporter ATP-binding protein [Rhizobiales bacterium]|nr:thiamine ABC transporter ATP-binding protein [Hyphomicrobiales bacterium]
MIRLDRVTFRYEEMRMEFDLQVAKGEFLGIIGPSGSGKSTLLNLIAGFETPESGRVLIAGSDVTALPPAARPVSMIFQDNNSFAHLDVWTNVALGVSPSLKLDADQRARIEAALQATGLETYARRKPGELSGGERQRIAIARALVRDKPVLLLDEPFTALGPRLRQDMLDLVVDLHKSHGLTTLMVSHHPEDARRAADRSAFISHGRILAIAPTADLFTASRHPEISEYLGQ